ncbi:MAG: mannonate dehydratase [Bryobacteraceae bacterium]|nr:mannonate dehydratase [Bryobacteraceae bacterium]
MPSRYTRRAALAAAAATSAALPFSAAAQNSSASRRKWPIPEGPDTPKLCLDLASTNHNEKGARRLLQLGVTHCLTGGPRMPWTEADLRQMIGNLKQHGITLYNLMIGGFPNAIYGRPGRDEEIENLHQSIRAAGRAGLPVIEYNFYAHRLVEGYYEQTGRGGSGLTAYDYERSKNLPPLPEVGVHSLEQLWKNAEYFLKAVIPVAQQAGVKMALHPNDPPVPLSRGSGQIMGTVAGWKRYTSIVDSPSNGITFDCGVTAEMGEDAVEVCRYFASRQRINHVHFRNVIVRKPYIDYTEMAPDEGIVDMVGVMNELVGNRYTGTIYPEHPRALDADREAGGPKPYYPGGGGYTAFAYNVGYTRALLQNALRSRG